MASALDRALTAPGLRPLPDEVAGLLRELEAPARLAAHLRAVHDVAWHLLDWLAAAHPRVRVDRDAVVFGAATHDIGKAVHTAELSGPGAEHERAGHALLLERGVEERLARFARTHASWSGPDVTLEDLLVSLADKVWKAKRVPDLEQRVVEHLAAASGLPPWQAFLDLDDVLDRIAAEADHRLAFQNAHPVRP
ncbi:MAG TPA: HD domain-containing protein [Thermomonospora sp.]|nr:HD domain-containing protein [Thermomonospora sp.]